MKKLILFLFTLSLFSCNNNSIFEKYKSIDNYTWKYSEPVTFNVPVLITNENFNIFFNIRHTGNYSYRNIWVTVSIINPGGKVVDEIKSEFKLAEKDGQWTGQGLGDVIDHQYLLKNNFKFGEPGTYKFRIQHQMREDDLKGVMDVGIKVVRSEK